MILDHTHDPARRSFVAAANDPASDFPIQNLPLGVFEAPGLTKRGGIAIGDRILDLAAVHEARLFASDVAREAAAAAAADLSALLRLGRPALTALRIAASELLDQEGEKEAAVAACLVPATAARLHLPVPVSAFTDMCVSTYHIGRRIGVDDRGEPICPPMFRTLPVGYDGRANSVVVSGEPVRRPNGTWQQTPGEGSPEFGPEPRLDYELELGIWIGGAANPLGTPLLMSEAASRIAGYSLINDWSARGIQFWESMLGPFLGKSFSTTVSPWIITEDALKPFRTAAFARPPGDPPVPPHLHDPVDQAVGGIDLVMEAWREAPGHPATRMCRTNFSHMYWTPAQMIAHHASNGCSLSAGHLVGSGTCSGADLEAAGCLLEVLGLGGGTGVAVGQTGWLADGETVILRARAEREGFRTIGFGEARATVLPATRWPEASDGTSAAARGEHDAATPD